MLERDLVRVKIRLTEAGQGRRCRYLTAGWAKNGDVRYRRQRNQPRSAHDACLRKPEFSDSSGALGAGRSLLPEYPAQIAG